MNHPEVDWIERTGYPSWMQDEDDKDVIYCDECGKALTVEDDIYEDEHHTNLCKDCLLFLHEKDW